MVGSVVGQNVVKTESTTPNGNGAETFNGNSMPRSTQHVEHPSGQSFRIRYAFLAIFMLSSELIGSSFFHWAFSKLSLGSSSASLHLLQLYLPIYGHALVV